MRPPNQFVFKTPAFMLTFFKLVETKKPAELSQITSLSDFPVPTALENIFKPSEKSGEEETDGETPKRK
jgi:hypothetical protein